MNATRDSKKRPQTSKDPFHASRFTDASLAEEEQYNSSAKKAGENISHFHHHYDPKIKSKASRISKASSSYAKPDHLEVLKDENKTLKNRQNELEHDI
jgi:hypothetical protein